MSDASTTAASTTDAPHPGSQAMPRWNTGELIDAPRFTTRNWFALLGPGLLMGGAAIGGGEWLVGPIVTAKYGGALLWLATLSILGQVVYNIEISRYTLYTGEPIFTGKFRTLPGPMFWVFVYLLLDFGSIFPYLAASAATPLAAVFLGEIPNAATGVAEYSFLGLEGTLTHKTLLRILGYAIFLAALVPLVFGGKIYNALKALMTFKIVVVLGFLTILAIGWSTPRTWGEILSGFVSFGSVPVRSVEDLNGNGRLDPGEDFDGDGRRDVMEPTLKLQFGTIFRDAYATNIDQDREPDPMVDIEISDPAEADHSAANSKTVPWPDLNRDGQPDSAVTIDVTGDGQPDGTYNLVRGPKGEVLFQHPRSEKPVPFIDIDGDGIRDGDRVASVFSGERPEIDWSLIAFLSALVAISGSGGLSNTPVSNYTRDQGWGMGHHVGAIPSVVGGQDLQLSHVGTVFHPTQEALPRWKRWYKHVVRDQTAVWMPACFLGLALPSMLSVQFLQRGTEADNWTAAGMTANQVQEAVGGSVHHAHLNDLQTGALFRFSARATLYEYRGNGSYGTPAGSEGGPWRRNDNPPVLVEPSAPALGEFFWFMTLFCGFLVLAPSMATSADGVIRRWVDVFWTASPGLRQIKPRNIRYVYFTVLVCYAIFGMVMLSLNEPTALLKIATTIYNFALGFSCWHALVVNLVLLPAPLRPNWFVRIALALAGVFFLVVAYFSAAQTLGWL